MSLLQHNGFRSLRSQLVLSSLLVQVVMLAILVWNSVRITDNALHELFQEQVDSMVTMMAVSLANPLVQRDYATLDERLGRFLQQDSLVYVVVHDEMGRVAAQRGEVPGKERLDNSFNMPDKIYGQAFDITVAGRVVGRAHYGLDVSLLKNTVSNLRTQGITVALIAILLTFLLLATIVYLVTRRLRALALAAQAIRSGDYSVRVAVAGRDEVAVTAQTFNSMAETLARDINERKQAEEKLKQSEQHLRDIFDGLGPNIFVGLLSTEGVVLEANKQALAAAGLKPEDALGKPVEETYWFAYSEAIKQQMRQAVIRAAHGDASRFDIQIRVAENQFIPLDLSIQPFRDETGKVVLLVPSAIVIAERVQAEQALHESEERLRLALDAAHMGTFDWDVPNDYITWSRWHEELWGFQPGQFDNTFTTVAQRLHPDDLPGVNAEITRCIATHEPFVGEFRVVWPDGSIHWISSRGEFTFDTSGQPLRMRGAVVEVTERKQAEDILKAYSRQLQALSKRVLEVQEAERRHIARELHDELGQILTALKINLQARNRLNNPSPGEIDSANIGMVEDAIGHVRRMALALRPPMIDDLGLLPALHWAAEQSIARAGLAVQWQSDLTDQRLTPEIETACFRIAQEAFTNIMRHAQAHNVKIEIQHAGDHLLLIVQDDGCGFDVAAMRARATAGISIGVLGMQERAILAGGELQIASVPGQGTTIRARFPWRVFGEENMQGNET